MALEMRSICERCRGALTPDGEAWICSFECTFCTSCASELGRRCPNCGGELVRRPRRKVGGHVQLLPLLAGLGALLLGLLVAPPVPAQTAAPAAPERGAVEAPWVLEEHYRKEEVMIPMRDGVRLFTSIYHPRDGTRSYPILMRRTPYSVRPYGEDAYRTSLGPSPEFDRRGYIVVFQDVRGCYMSEGSFVNMRPHIEDKEEVWQVDESSDTSDTIQWLLDHVPHHNGRVGMWGISYPGFYAAAGMIDAHPALKAVSPQAPIADWWFDDFHHHGAFFLPHAFGFLSSFGVPRPEPTTRRNPRFRYPTPDGYAFFLELGSLKNVNERYFHGKIPFWNDIVAHPNYDEFWQARNLLPHLNRVAPAVMTVGGWFDAEDLYGPLQIYRSVEERNPGVSNILVMGPWAHGGWARSDGDRLGNVGFGSKTSEWYRNEVQLPFFEHHLRGGPDPALPEALVFDTGSLEWKRFDRWPPSSAVARALHFHPGRELKFSVSQAVERSWRDLSPEEMAAYGPDGSWPEDTGFDEFLSDPNQPVPFTEEISPRMTRAYMTDDQRFASRRPDVLSYQTQVLEEDLTVVGPVSADLWVETTGTDADWIVKLIDVFPPDAEDPEWMVDGKRMAGYQMMVRSEVLRGRFRNSYENPEAFAPHKLTRVRVPLQDVLHTFKKGHRLMVQVQCTWFPLVDRNPQKYVPNIYLAEDEDFESAWMAVYHSAEHSSRIQMQTLGRALPPSD